MRDTMEAISYNGRLGPGSICSAVGGQGPFLGGLYVVAKSATTHRLESFQLLAPPHASVLLPTDRMCYVKTRNPDSTSRRRWRRPWYRTPAARL